MKVAVPFTANLLALTASHPNLARQDENANPHDWIPAGPDDFRGPCPMMNTLANHGFLPHDGRNLTKSAIVKGLGDGLNFNQSLAELMFEMALIANPEPNATFFTLDMLNVHNVLEHDASLTRTDAYFGNNHVFNQTIYETSKRYWTAETVTSAMLANSKLARQIESKAFNPEYRFTQTVEQFSLGEIIAPIIAFGDLKDATVPRNLMQYFFENERLPTELGWSRKGDPITLEDITRLTTIMAAATSLITEDGNSTTAKVEKRFADMHAGMRL
ncbi:Cloroperoxidase [Byssothecium circinans]|uniref:Cloroperoxidase n=1 Tax=Byssothecium circinans TaxID=147558 RepID=A0A6A5U4K8_9PLEO|nr:Cloroperoxidase [Byssothecium circinans]